MNNNTYLNQILTHGNNNNIEQASKKGKEMKNI